MLGVQGEDEKDVAIANLIESLKNKTNGRIFLKIARKLFGYFVLFKYKRKYTKVYFKVTNKT